MLTEHSFKNRMNPCPKSSKPDHGHDDRYDQYMSNIDHDSKKDEQNNIKDSSFTLREHFTYQDVTHRNKITECEFLTEHMDKTYSDCTPNCTTIRHLVKDKHVQVVQYERNAEQTRTESVTSLSSYLSSISSSGSGSYCVSSLVSSDVYTPSESDILFQLLPTAPPNSDIESDFFSDNDDDKFSSQLMNVTSESQFETQEVTSAHVFNCLEDTASKQDAFEFSDVKRWLREDVVSHLSLMKLKTYNSLPDLNKQYQTVGSVMQTSQSFSDVNCLTLEDDLMHQPSRNIVGLNLDFFDNGEDSSLSELEASHRSVSMCSLNSTEANCSLCCCCCRYCCGTPCCQ